MTPTQDKHTPWWRVGPMWLVVGFPAAALIAGVVTVLLALRAPDPAASAPASGTARQAALVPALQARNQVADRNDRRRRQQED